MDDDDNFMQGLIQRWYLAEASDEDGEDDKDDADGDKDGDDNDVNYVWNSAGQGSMDSECFSHMCFSW